MGRGGEPGELFFFSFPGSFLRLGLGGENVFFNFPGGVGRFLLLFFFFLDLYGLYRRIGRNYG